MKRFGIKRFGKVVREARIKAGLTQQELANAVGFSVQYISDIERCRAEGTASTIASICKVLDLSMDKIFLSSEYNNIRQEEVNKN